MKKNIVKNGLTFFGFSWLFVFLFSNYLFAQETEFNGEIKWSELFPVNRSTASPEIIGHNGESIFLTRLIKGKRYVEKYSLSTLTLQKSLRIELEYEENDLTVSDQFMLNNEPVLLAGYFDKRTKTAATYLVTIDPETLTPGTPKKITTTFMENMKNIGIASAIMPQGMLNSAMANGIVISPDKKMAYTSYPADALDRDAAITNYNSKSVIIDENLDVIEGAEYKFPYPSFVPVQTRLSNDGQVYYLGYELEIDEEERKRIFGGARFKMGKIHLVVLDPESGDYLTYDPVFEGRQVEMMTFNFTDDGGLAIGGLTSTEGNGVNGCFYIKLDKDLNEVSSSTDDFETDFITASWSEKKKEDLEKKQNRGRDVEEPQLYNYYIDHLITKPDGSSLMLAEQYYVRVVTHTYSTPNGGTQTTTTYYYYYNDIIALNFDKSGDLLWKKVIHKKQVSTNDGGYYSSYFVVQDGNDVNIIYNDNEVNYVDTEGMSNAELKALKRSTIGACVRLDADGEITKQKLFEFEEGGLRLVPKICNAASADLVFLYARSVKGDKVGTIQFN